MTLFGCCLYATAFLLCLCQYSQAAEDNRILICYLNGDFFTRNPNFLIINIDPFLCTHIVYGPVYIESGTIDVPAKVDFCRHNGLNLFAQMKALRETNPKLKVLASVVPHPTCIRDAESRQQIVSSATKFLREQKFDGLEVVAYRQIEEFTNLLKELKMEFDKYGYYLSFSIPCFTLEAETTNGTTPLSEISDAVNSISVNFGSSFCSIPNAFYVNSPLKSNDGFGIENCINDALRLVPNNKLVLMFSIKGTLFAERDSGAIIEPSDISYYEICKLLKIESWSETWDESTLTPMAVKGRNKITYQNERSVALKAQFAVTQRLKGIVVSDIETDDFQGVCSQDYLKFPLVNKIKEELGLKLKKFPGEVSIVIEKYY